MLYYKRCLENKLYLKCHIIQKQIIHRIFFKISMLLELNLERSLNLIMLSNKNEYITSLKIFNLKGSQRLKLLSILIESHFSLKNHNTSRCVSLALLPNVLEISHL